jgi:hypothetical protein
MIVCVPPCAVCSGLCKMEPLKRDALEQPAEPYSPVLARQAGYIPMACKHYTTREEQILITGRFKKTGTLWCEVCGSWKKRRKILDAINDEPKGELF